MSRLTPKTETVRALFARSGNKCAFPGCAAHLINEKNIFVGQICHIEAAEVGGERYNPAQNDEQRRHYDNLIILCYPHHIETNDTQLYPTARLHNIKIAHESNHMHNTFKIDESLLYKVIHEMEDYWKKIDHDHKTKHVLLELAIPVDAHSSYLSLAQEAYILIEQLQDHSYTIETSDNELQSRIKKLITQKVSGEISDDDYDNELFSLANHNWEILNLGVRNSLNKLHVTLVQMEIKFLEEFLKTNGSDKTARARLNKLKIDFEEIATQAGYAD